MEGPHFYGPPAGLGRVTIQLLLTSDEQSPNDPPEDARLVYLGGALDLQRMCTIESSDDTTITRWSTCFMCARGVTPIFTLNQSGLTITDT